MRPLPRLTIRQIAERVKETQPFFFSKKTMKFFSETMNDFSVKKLDAIGKYLVSSRKTGLVRYFNPVTNDFEIVPSNEPSHV